MPPCAPSALSIAVRFVQGTAENWLIPVTFTNVSATNCSVFGYPTLSLVNEAGQTVGMPVKDSQDGEPLRSITLEPRESAWASLWQPEHDGHGQRITAVLARPVDFNPSGVSGSRGCDGVLRRLVQGDHNL